MESVFSELKRAREAKRLTLSDISDATSINIRFLEAIEQGDTGVLPEPYIRAFVREYARVLDLDEEEIVHAYDRMTRQPQEEIPGKQEELSEPLVTEPKTDTTPIADRASFATRIAQYAIVGLALAALAIGLWNMLRAPRGAYPPESDSPQKPQREVQTPIREETQTHQPSPSQATTPHRDSLHLAARTTDSVWIRLQIDNLPAQEYLLGGRQRMSWKARDRFLLTVGNAGGVTLTLNNKPLSALGRRGAVVRDKEITRALLPQN